jgi:hypothetical protein
MKPQMKGLTNGSGGGEFMGNIRTILYYGVNSLCCLLYRKEYRKFSSVEDAGQLQEAILLDILKRNEKTVYGEQHHFNEINSIGAYQAQVPISDYEAYRLYIEQLEEKEEKLLTEEKIITFEPTSGSTKAAKLIPYTKSLKEEFQKGIKPWIYNLYTAYPEIRWGKSYWSVSPAATQKKYTRSGIPIGFEEDSEYFGKIEKYLMDIIFVRPKEIQKETNMDRFYARTAVELLKSRDLTLISVWNPTFLLLLLDYIALHKDELLDHLPKSRQKEIGQAVDKKAYHQIWKNLKVISCWCDANAAPYADRLHALFPNVVIQPKGLLSTECFISFPVAGEWGGVLSVNSHFFEFKEESCDKVSLLQELTVGKQYEVIVTTGGGFYRYRTYDMVEVVGWYHNLPLLIFKGKSDRVSDKFGEKLHEAFVRQVVERLAPNHTFFMMSPQKDCYILYIKGEILPGANELDDALRESFHYDYCRRLGQLKKAKVFALTGNPDKEYIEGCLQAGQKLGDIKPTHLSRREDWNQFFQGNYMEA